MANSITCRHAVMSATLSANQSRKARTHVGKWESSPYDGFHGIDVLVCTLFDVWEVEGGWRPWSYGENHAAMRELFSLSRTLSR
jgi:hypothetical protein